MNIVKLKCLYSYSWPGFHIRSTGGTFSKSTNLATKPDDSAARSPGCCAGHVYLEVLPSRPGVCHGSASSCRLSHSWGTRIYIAGNTIMGQCIWGSSPLDSWFGQWVAYKSIGESRGCPGSDPYALGSCHVCLC